MKLIWFGLILASLVLGGCTFLSDCGDSPSCFRQKISSCEAGATFSEDDSYVPWHAQIVGLDSGQCVIEYRACDPSKGGCLLSDEPDMETYTCLASDYEEFSQAGSLLWISEHISAESGEFSMMCFYLSEKLGSDKQFFE